MIASRWPFSRLRQINIFPINCLEERIEMTESLQFSNETGVALCNGVYASESNTCDDDSTSCKNTKEKATLAKEVLEIFLN